MIRENKLPKKVYHYTNESNFKNIMEDKKLKPLCGEIFLTETLEECKDFLKRYIEMSEVYYILEIETKSSKMDELYYQESFDHNPIFFDNARAFIYSKEININLDTVEIYKI